MIEKKRRLTIPSLSVRSTLLLILFLPALTFWLYLSLITGSIKTIIISGLFALLGFLGTWFMGEILLLGRTNRLIASLRNLFNTLVMDKSLLTCHDRGIGALTTCVDQLAVKLAKRFECQQQEIETLKQSRNKWFNIIDSLPDATFAIDTEGKVMVWNHAIEELTGIEAANMIGKADREYSVPFYGAKKNMLINHVFLPHKENENHHISIRRSGKRLYGVGVIRVHRSEQPIHFWGMASPIYDDAGHIIGAIETIRDVSDYKKTEKDLLDGKAKYQALFDSANDAVTLMINDVFIDCNQKALNLFGCAKEAFIGQTPQRFSPLRQPDGKSSAEAALEKISGALQGTPQFFTWTHCRIDGKPFDAEISLDAVKLASGEVIVQSIIRDITERKQAEKIIRQFAFHDPLTALPNRKLLFDRCNMEIANAARRQRQFAVLVLDIDYFKDIKNYLGHDIGAQIGRAHV